MPEFSSKSQGKLNSCHEKLQVICNEAIKITDFTVLCGHRNEIEQNKVYESGNSEVRWPRSKHNSHPSMAVDIAPYPIDWNDTERFARLAGVMDAIAFKYGVKLKWGGDFESLKDMPHFQIED